MRGTLWAICCVLVWPTLGAAQPVVDGVVDALYGNPVALDKVGDGNGQPVMDLKELYMWHDATHLYVAFTISGNVSGVNDWGKYILYVDTTNDTAGATSDPWLRNVVALDPHKPEFTVTTWVDNLPYGANRTEIWGWAANAWTLGSTTATDAALKATGQGSVIEYQLPLSAIGSPTQIWVGLWSTSGTTTDNAQDTVNLPAEDWNATDWTTQAQLKVSTPYSLALPPDAGVPDQMVPDAGVPDLMASDLMVPDSTIPDAAVPDTMVPDSMPLDSAPPDSMAPDASVPDSAPAPDAGPGLDSSAPDQAQPDTTTPGDQPMSEGPTADADPPADGGVPDGTELTDGPPAADSGTKRTQDEGCSCSVSAAPGGEALLLALFLGLWLVRRRRGSYQ